MAFGHLNPVATEVQKGSFEAEILEKSIRHQFVEEFQGGLDWSARHSPWENSRQNQRHIHTRSSLKHYRAMVPRFHQHHQLGLDRLEVLVAQDWVSQKKHFGERSKELAA